MIAFCEFDVEELPGGKFRQTCRHCGAKAIVPTRKYGRQCKANRALPGTELHSLLLRMGFKPESGCKCVKRALTMDAWGPDLCRQNIDTIAGWIEEESSRRGLPFVRIVAVQLVKLAIRRAEAKVSRRRGS